MFCVSCGAGRVAGGAFCAGCGSPFESSRHTSAVPARSCVQSRPDLVLQEIWGHLCCHYAIRCLMAQAATHSGHDRDRVSFVAALRITRQTLAHPGAFPP